MGSVFRKFWPIQFDDKDTMQGKITSHFGPRPNPITQEFEKHTGFDLYSLKATPLICPENSTILGCFMAPDGLYGNHVVIKTDSGYKWQSWHLNGFSGKIYRDGEWIDLFTNRAKGVRVRAGQVLAFTGNTGKFTTGAHVHIRVAKYPTTRIAIDPLEYYGLYDCFSVDDTPYDISDKLNQLKNNINSDCDELKRFIMRV